MREVSASLMTPRFSDEENEIHLGSIQPATQTVQKKSRKKLENLWFTRKRFPIRFWNNPTSFFNSNVKRFLTLFLLYVCKIRSSFSISLARWYLINYLLFLLSFLKPFFFLPQFTFFDTLSPRACCPIENRTDTDAQNKMVHPRLSFNVMITPSKS